MLKSSWIFHPFKSISLSSHYHIPQLKRKKYIDIRPIDSRLYFVILCSPNYHLWSVLFVITCSRLVTCWLFMYSSVLNIHCQEFILFLCIWTLGCIIVWLATCLNIVQRSGIEPMLYFWKTSVKHPGNRDYTTNLYN
jgi:hypothetical protein